MWRGKITFTIHHTCNFYEIIESLARQVISREGCHDMESQEYRIQVEGLSGGKMSMGVEHNSVFEQERTQVFCDKYLMYGYIS